MPKLDAKQQLAVLNITQALRAAAIKTDPRVDGIPDAMVAERLEQDARNVADVSPELAGFLESLALGIRGALELAGKA